MENKKQDLKQIKDKWRIQQELKRKYEERKLKLIEEYEKQRAKVIKKQKSLHERRSKSNSPQQRTSFSDDSSKNEYVIGTSMIGNGAEGVIDETDLKKIKINIHQRIFTKEQNISNEIKRNIINLKDITVPRRPNEGMCPIFQRSKGKQTYNGIQNIYNITQNISTQNVSTQNVSTQNVSNQNVSTHNISQNNISQNITFNKNKNTFSKDKQLVSKKEFTTHRKDSDMHRTSDNNITQYNRSNKSTTYRNDEIRNNSGCNCNRTKNSPVRNNGKRFWPPDRVYDQYKPYPFSRLSMRRTQTPPIFIPIYPGLWPPPFLMNIQQPQVSSFINDKRN